MTEATDKEIADLSRKVAKLRIAYDRAYAEQLVAYTTMIEGEGELNALLEGDK